jgi:mitochondrial fission protein ELM1
MSRPFSCWAMTTGEAGTRAQALGLAESLGVPFEEKIIGLRPPWSWFPGAWCPVPLVGLDPSKDTLSPPWPDLLITCGRRSTAPSIAIRRASGGRTTTVHVQNPQTRLDAFDLVFPMRHDGVTGPNAIPLDTAIHRITPEALAQAATEWRERFADLPTPLVGVILGGRNRSYRFTEAIGRSLLERLDALHGTTGAGLVITPSRRTEPEIIALVSEWARGRSWIRWYSGEGDNPYVGILGLADALIVTSDSVSMLSEAISTGRPVAAVRPEGRSRRHELFLERLEAVGAVVPFAGELPVTNGSAVPNAARMAGDAVLKLMNSRGF